MTADGVPLRSTVASDRSDEHAATLSQLTARASASVRSLDPNDELAFLRVRTKLGYEYMVVPDGEYVLCVINKI